MKKELLVAFALVLSWGILNGQKRSISLMLQTTYFKEDTTSLLRNPAMGWGVYDDANTEVQNAEEYWKAQDIAGGRTWNLRKESMPGSTMRTIKN